MSTSITTINATDLITNSRNDLNNNFASLNTNKIETSVIDTDATLASNSDAKIPSQKAVKAYVDAGGNVNASTSTKGIVQEATSAQIIAGSSNGSTGAPLFVNPSMLQAAGLFKFGGTGSDGALSISSGTTTISASGARILMKNYTSISITGTGKLGFSNPHANGTFIFLRSQGNVTLTSSATPMIDHTNMGGAGGTNANKTSTTAGTTGTAGIWGNYNCAPGLGGTNSTSPPAGGVFSMSPDTTLVDAVVQKYPMLFIGAGSGSGTVAVSGTGNGTGGTGGNGCGALMIECGGTFTFTTANGLSVSGTAGGNGVVNSGSNVWCDGGTGGANGSLLVLYNTAGTISGTVSTSAAAAGTGTTTGTVSQAHSSASAGASLGTIGTVGVNLGNTGSAGNGNVGTALTTFYLIALNTIYA